MMEPNELRAGDKVRLVNIKPPRDYLNGKEGFIESKNVGNNDTIDPSLAVLPGNKYVVLVELENTQTPSNKPGVAQSESKLFKLKRQNLMIVEGSIQTHVAPFTSSGESIDLGGVKMAFTTQLEREDPGIAGLFPAVIHNDVARVREIMEHIKASGHPAPADSHYDCVGNTLLLRAVEEGRKDVIQVLLEYGADVNAKYGLLNPLKKKLDLSSLLLAICAVAGDRDQSIERQKEREDIVFLLIEAGADVNKVSSDRGSPLALACGNSIPPKRWEFRLKLVKTLLAKGAIPCNAKLASGSSISPLIQACCLAFFGSEENHLEAVQLLLDYGADPGEMEGTERCQKCTALHLVASRRLWRVMEALLKSEKGRAAVNKKMFASDDKNEDTPLFVALDDEKLVSSNTTDSRRSVALLLQYGADVFIKNAAGCFPYYGLSTSDHPKIKELRRLVDNAPPLCDSDAVFSYWTSPEVQEWIGHGTSTKRRCPVCLIWSDLQRQHNQVEFKACSRCGKQYYCSRECQKAHWKIHKQACVSKK